MITKHPGIGRITFKVRVEFEDGNEYEIRLDVHEMNRLIVRGELPASIKSQRDAIEASKEEETTEE